MKSTYNFKSIVQIQKWEWEDVIAKKVNIGGHKVIIDIAIKRLKKIYWFYFLFKPHHFFYFFTNSCNFECVFKNS